MSLSIEFIKTTKKLQHIKAIKHYFNKRKDLKHLAENNVKLPIDFTEDIMLASGKIKTTKQIS